MFYCTRHQSETNLFKNDDFEIGKVLNNFVKETLHTPESKQNAIPIYDHNGFWWIVVSVEL